MLQIIEITYMICFFCIGTLFGSFFSLAIYRIPRKQDIMIKRSYCPKCKHDLGFLDLIPILSYIFRMGKCKYCKEKISPIYIILEISNGILFLFIYILFKNIFITCLILLIYILLFVCIGSKFMKKKMNDSKNINNKKGVFNIELLIAMFAFAIYFGTAIYMSRNYSETLIISNIRSLAFNIASNNLETGKSTNYENLVSVNSSEQILDNYGFVSELLVDEYVYDKNGSSEKYAKKITSIATYKYGDKQYKVILEDIKHKRGGF